MSARARDQKQQRSPATLQPVPVTPVDAPSAHAEAYQVKTHTLLLALVVASCLVGAWMLVPRGGGRARKAGPLFPPTFHGKFKHAGSRGKVFMTFFFPHYHHHHVQSTIDSIRHDDQLIKLSGTSDELFDWSQWIKEAHREITAYPAGRLDDQHKFEVLKRK